ncbi:hypothetical protein ACFPM3_07475 [Streptomyces coeruleoprunus]|uniref:Uncharacterized protein n=1 Tax=Streptomyces coeruleoprunus TaxID=285563 RepID=A0ABV9XBZ3_9ACTN
MAHGRAARAVVVAVYCAGLAVGTVTHVSDVVLHGPLPHAAFAPWWVDLYWTSLAVLDPLALVLLVRGRRAGVDLLCAVMATDLAANAYAVLVLKGEAAGDFPGLQRLALFGLFVAVTAPWLRRRPERAPG